MKVIVVGGGKIGTYLCKLLLDGGHKVVVIENRAGEMPQLGTDLPPDVARCGDGTSPLVLEAAGIRQVDVVAAVTGADETNLVVTSLAKFEFRVPRTIARVNNPKNVWMFTREMGVDVALNQADLMGHLIAEEMSLGDMMTLLKLRKGEFSIVEEKVHSASSAAGRAIRDLQLPSDCIIVGILRKGEMVIPHGDTVLHPADEVLAVVRNSHVATLATLLSKA